MASESTESESDGFHDIIEITISDAIQRAGVWGDFAKEFLRLSMLAAAMRGSPQIIDLACRSASASRDAMVAEIDKAERRLNLWRDLLSKIEADLSAPLEENPCQS